MKANPTSYSPKTQEILALTDVPYDEYNRVLPIIKARIKNLDNFGVVREGTFERVLAEELPENTVRRAYRIAILVAAGEKIQRDLKFTPKPEGPGKKTENGKTARRAQS